MGLNHPLDLNAWHAWQRRQNVPRWVKDSVKGALHQSRTEEPVSGMLYTRGENPQLLIVLDSFSPTSRHALLEPLKHMGNLSVALWCPLEGQEHLQEYLQDHSEDWNHAPLSAADLWERLPQISLILALGHYLPRGYAAYRFARERGADYWVVQHGLLVPQAPPLPIGSTLLAFSDADAQFWISGRQDVRSYTVGLQLLYRAAEKALANSEAGAVYAQPEDSSGQQDILFLGQMHGAELPRTSFAKAAYRFLSRYGGIYRPHPSETDKLSRATHALWQKRGIRIDRSGAPLSEMPNPVVSVFSTGVLEAAIRGIPAWVYHPNPPEWLEEFWARYGMSTWGNDPTFAPPQPAVEPAYSIAQLILEHLEVPA